MAWNTYLIYSILLLYECQHIRSVNIVSLIVPEVADIRDVANLSCIFNMNNNKLNSVKWYKDNSEFFRYSPLSDKQFSTWSVEGVNFAKDSPYKCFQEACSVNLDNLNTKTSGAYRCEISGDAPEFKLAEYTQNMTIVALPRLDPVITGLRHSYDFGDHVSANCTSDMSNPPAKLTWFLNNDKASQDLLMPQTETTMDHEGLNLRYRTSEIRFVLDERRFAHFRGRFTLRCLAIIEKIPFSKREAHAFVYIQSDLNNERYTNPNSSSTRKPARLELLLVSVIIAVSLIRSHLL